MYLHLGNEIIVKKEEIIGIFDLDNASLSHLTREFLRKEEQRGRVVNVSEELPKSFVVSVGKDGKKTLFLSQLASFTLLKRSEIF